MGESGKPGRDDADLKGVRRRAVEGVEVAVGETFEREQLARATHLSAKAPLGVAFRLAVTDKKDVS